MSRWSTVRSAARTTVTVLAFVFVWVALVLPDRLDRLGLVSLLRIPLEGLALVALCSVLPRWPRRVTSAVVGAVVGLLVIAKLLDMGFYAALNRPFNPVIDWSSLRPAVGVLKDFVGKRSTNVLVVVALVVVVLLLTLLALALVRVTDLTARHRTASLRVVAALAVVWADLAVAGVDVATETPVASISTATLAADEVSGVHAAVHDRGVFADILARPDPMAHTPSTELLNGLRGKDVIVAFVESYGKVAVRDTTFSPGVDAVLRDGRHALAHKGFHTASAFLTSPTFGGISWLAHSTLQSGLWIDTQQRYDQLMDSDRYTLSDAFRRAGWRTVVDDPSNAGDWPQGRSFYHYDKEYNAGNIGYRGPRFSYARIPDQFTLSRFRSAELAPGHRPVMAEIDLVSSHTPWTPLPHMLPWNALGDGSVYGPMQANGPTPTEVWRSAADVQRMYGRSIQYSLRSLVSFVTTTNDPDLVLVILGDHEPAPIVSGSDASYDVPISIVYADPAVGQRIAHWNWSPGMLPGPDAPVWPMSAFRNRFLDAFSQSHG